MTDHTTPDQQPTPTPNGQAAKGKKQLTPLDKVSMSTKHDGEAIIARPVAHYQHTSKGLFYVGVSVDKKTGATIQAAPQRLSDDVELFGCGKDRDGSYYRMLRFKACGSGVLVELAFPRRCIDSSKGMEMLRDKGLSIDATPWAKVRFNNFLDSNEEGSQKMYALTDKAGWQYGAYMLPGGAVIGEPSTPLFYNGEQHLADTYAPSNHSPTHPHGDPTEWREEVASLARGNSRFQLAIGCAFAAPLMHLVGMESGGVHIYGTTTDGKTTAALTGGSVWGAPEDQKLSWNATTYALSNEAAARNDGLMILDEVGQSEPGTVAQAAYNLFNGKGKLQGTKDGGNRKAKSWRVMVISTGEHPIDTFVSDGGKRFNGGQEVRLPSIPADAGCCMGAIEQLHQHPTKEAFADAIAKAGAKHYGSAGRAFLERIQQMPEGALQARIDGAIKRWQDELGQATGPVKRVARRFAMIGVSLELATEFNLTGWDAGEGDAAARRCFDDWLRRNGQVRNEEGLIIKQAEAFFASYGLNRFHRMRPGYQIEPNHGPNAAGYLRHGDGGGQYLVYPHVFEDEIAKGFDRNKVVAVLKAAGMLKVPDTKDNRPCKTHRVPSDINPKETTPKRLYEFVRTTNAADDDEPSPPDNTSSDTEPSGQPIQSSQEQPEPTPEENHAQLPVTTTRTVTAASPPTGRQHRDASSGAPGPVADYREGGTIAPSREGGSQEKGSDPGGHAGSSESGHSGGILPRQATERGGHHDGPDTPR
jgi:putative DNA primase/helicase